MSDAKKTARPAPIPAHPLASLRIAGTVGPRHHEVRRVARPVASERSGRSTGRAGSHGLLGLAVGALVAVSVVGCAGPRRVAAGTAGAPDLHAPGWAAE